MLAEQASYTEIVIPKMLQDKAIRLADEFSWPASEALQVVDWLEANGQEVVGVELWRNIQGKPLFISSSDYSPGLDDQVTSVSIAWCAHKARLFIVRFSHEQEALFNITSAQPPAELDSVSMDSGLPIHSRVRLSTEKYQPEGASCFEVGYIIEAYPDNKYEVEFSDLNGITTAQMVVSGEEIEFAEPTFAAPKRNPNAPRLEMDPVKEYNL